MKVNTSEFLAAVETAMPAIGGDIIESNYIIFIDDYIISYNDEIIILVPFKDIGFNGGIQGKALHSLLKRLKSETVEILAKDEELILKSGRSRSGFKALTEYEAIPIEEGFKQSDLDWKKIKDSAKFAKLTEFTLKGCSKDRSDPVLSTLNMTRQGILMGSDGFKIIKSNLGFKLPIKDVLVPMTSAQKALKIKPTSIAQRDGWLYFRNRDTQTLVGCRVFKDKFPEVEDHFSFGGTTVEFPESLLDSIISARIFTKTDDVFDEIINFQMEDNKLSIYGEDVDRNWYRETMAIEYDEEPVNFSLSPYLFVDMLKQTNVCTIGEKKASFQGEGWEYLFMLRGQE